jgi:hypothetical protein
MARTVREPNAALPNPIPNPNPNLNPTLTLTPTPNLDPRQATPTPPGD